MITLVNFKVICGALLSTVLLTGSVNHYNKLALWLANDKAAAMSGFYQFPDFFNKNLSVIPKPIVKTLALNGMYTAQFRWAVSLLNEGKADEARLFWQSSAAKQNDSKREKLAQLLLKQNRWSDLTELATQGLIPPSDALEGLKLQLSYPPSSISDEFAQRSGFLLSSKLLVANTQCDYNVLMMTDHRQGLLTLNAFKQRYSANPMPTANSFCFSPPLYLGDTISCQSNPDKAASCNWQPLINKVRWPHNYDFIVMMPRVGSGNVRSGIMQLNSQSHYGLFLHELMHFSGFEDEYVLPKKKQAWLCQQSGFVAPNLFIAKNSPAPKNWYISESCQGQVKAYKPSKKWSIMQYQQLPISIEYRELWSQQIESKQYQPLRFVDYFNKVSETVTFIDKMTNNQNTE